MKTKQIKKRRGVTFTEADPIQDTILELEAMYDNGLDLTSIIRVALIEHKQKKLKEMGLGREVTVEEKKQIEAGLKSGFLTAQETKDGLAKLGIKI
jgi:hypothetical protein